MARRRHCQTGAVVPDRGIGPLAALLHVSQRTVQVWITKGLPVRKARMRPRRDGKRSNAAVWWESAEVVAWLRKKHLGGF